MMCSAMAELRMMFCGFAKKKKTNCEDQVV